MVNILITLIVGIFFSGCGYIIIKNHFYLRKNGEKTQAKIIGIAERTSAGSFSKVYAPIFEYVLSGKSFTKQSHYFTDKRPQIGKMIKIFYFKDKPDEAEIDNCFAFYGLGSLFMIVGIGMCLACLKRIFILVGF
jgi:hypothetical protein